MLAKGFKNVQLIGKSSDAWIDCVGWKKWKKHGLQAKFYKGSVGSPIVRNLVGSAQYHKCDCAILATTWRLTKQAREQALALWVKVWEY